MKSKLAFVGLAIVALAVAILWRKDPPVSVSGSDRQTVESATPAPVDEPKSVPRKISLTRLDRSNSPPIASVSVPADAASLLAAIAQGLASTNSDAREFALATLLPALVRIDPSAAGRLAETNAIADTREIVLERVARLLAAQNPADALKWAAGLPFDHEREGALTDVCLELALADPMEAIALRAGFLTENQSYDPLEDLTQQWAQKDFNAALDWIKQLPLDERRNVLLGRVAYLYSQTAPADAARLVVEEMSAGGAQTEAVVSVLHQWGLRDPAAAAAWVERFPESPLRERALRELAGIASSRSPSPAEL